MRYGIAPWKNYGRQDSAGIADIFWGQGTCSTLGECVLRESLSTSVAKWKTVSQALLTLPQQAQHGMQSTPFFNRLRFRLTCSSAGPSPWRRYAHSRKLRVPILHHLDITHGMLTITKGFEGPLLRYKDANGDTVSHLSTTTILFKPCFPIACGLSAFPSF